MGLHLSTLHTNDQISHDEPDSPSSLLLAKVMFFVWLYWQCRMFGFGVLVGVFDGVIVEMRTTVVACC